MPRCLRLLLTASALVVGLSACGSGAIDPGEVATKAEDDLDQDIGARPDVSCPESLERQVGAETRCTMTVEGMDGEFGLTVTVASVDGDDYTVEVRVDDEPTGGGRDPATEDG